MRSSDTSSTSNPPRPVSSHRFRCPGLLCATLLGCLIAVIAGLIFVYLRNNQPPKVPVVTWMAPEKNSFPALMQEAEKLNALQQTNPLRSKNSSEAALRAYVTAASPILDRVRNALDEPCEMLPEIKPDATAKPLANFETLVWAFRAEAELHARNRRYSRSMQSTLDALQLAVKLPKGGGLDAVITGERLQQISLAGAEEVLPRLIWPSLRKTVQRLRDIQGMRPPLAQNIQHDALWSEVRYATLFQDSSNRTVSGLRKLSKRDPGLGFIGSIHYNFSNKRALIAENTAYLNRLAREAEKPFYQRRPVFRPSNPIADHLGDYQKAARIDCASRAVVSLLQIQAALRLYHLQRDDYPRTLDALVSEYIPSLPEDPFTGKPFHYQRLKKSVYRLYSVGANMKDDHGKAGGWGSLSGDLVSGNLSSRKTLE
ncbi:MAG: hypothetical protein IT209_02990 [Armatimonadetes bacterium]|nr:hypothetical protein [Armatimonadota bacterium]